jgi:hypothetical protein
VTAKAYQGLAFEQYSAIPGVNASLLKRVANGSPLHGLHYLREGGGPDTHSRMELRATHTLALEGEAAFRRGYAVWEGKRQGQAWLDFSQQQVGAGRTVLTSAERARVQARAAALLAHPVAGPLLAHADARPEITVTWTDAATGLPCKARIDLWVDAEAGVTIADLKTWGSTDPLSVSREIARQLVHLQLAHYAEAVKALTGVAPTEAAVIVVEDKAPHDVGVYLLTMGGGLDIGRALWRRTMATWAEATRSGVYPGRIPEPYDLLLPSWAEEDLVTEDGEADG